MAKVILPPRPGAVNAHRLGWLELVIDANPNDILFNLALHGIDFFLIAVRRRQGR